MVGDDLESSALQGLLDEINRLGGADERLFVGPRDLRFAISNDTFIYYLLPNLRPVSRYLEMNPGCANRPGSGLAADISNANWVILTSRYESWREPNASLVPGPGEPNEVVRREFCLVSQYGEWKLLHRCGGKG